MQVDDVRGITGDWLDSVVAFGIISGIAGVCALIAYPLTGALSDRTTSRFGRRRPWILGGALAFAISLVVLGLQNTFVGLGIWWSLALTGFCVLTAALTATISDQVPVRQRGFVSGWISAPQAIGTILGLLLVTMVITSQVLGYVALAVLLLVLVVPFLLVVKDAVLPRDQRPKLTAAAVLRGMWVSPRKHPDFAWTLASRILINLGNALGTTLLFYFLQDGLKLPDPEDSLILLVAGLHGVRGARVPVPRPAQRRHGPPQAVRDVRRRPAGDRGAAAGARAELHGRDRRRRAARPRLRLLPRPSTRRSPRRCCRTPPTAARTSAS